MELPVSCAEVTKNKQDIMQALSNTIQLPNSNIEMTSHCQGDISNKMPPKYFLIL